MVVGGAQLLTPGSGDAHIVPEEPWHPVAGGYLRSVFYLNLPPIDWRLIAQEYEGVVEVGYGVSSVYAGLAAANGAVDHPAAIRAAIEAQDPLALYATSTRALSQLVRHHLETAAASLDNPGAAQDEVLRAQALFRALSEDWLDQFDSAAFSSLGRRWLELSNSIGSAGVGGVARRSSTASAFNAALAEINEYLIDNYETAPAATLTMPASLIGVSMMRSGPNSSTMPRVILNAPP